MTRQELLDSFDKSFGEKIQDQTEFRGETTFTIAASDLREIAKFCCDKLSFDYLLDITSIDNFGHDLRRILMWDGYPYFPLRKDFPLEGLPSEMPDVAFTKVTPMEGGPFVTVPSAATSKDREPRARPPEL